MQRRRIDQATALGFLCLFGAGVWGCGSDHTGGKGSPGTDDGPTGYAGASNNGMPSGSGSGAVGNTGMQMNPGNGNGSGNGTGASSSSSAHVRLVLKEVH
jgi:hypothetical protein